MKLEDRLSNDLRSSVERFAPRARTVEDLIPEPAPHAPSGRHRASLIIVGLAIGLTPVVLLALLFSRGARVSSVPPATRSSWSLPTNPCALLTEDQVAAATGANVLSSGLLPDSRMMVPGTPNPCEYKTDGKFGELITSVRPQGKQEFLDLQARDLSNTGPIKGLGDAAFIAGGASMYVQVGNGYFSIGVQLSAGSGAAPVLRELATQALSNISVPGEANASLSLDPTQSLAQAQQVSPFQILLPTALPQGTRLTRVDWLPPDQNGVMSIDVRWTTGFGGVHLWETNNPGIPRDKDPSNSKGGTSVAIAGQTWVLMPTRFRGLTQIGTRLQSGVTLEIDAQMRDPQLEALASSIAVGTVSSSPPSLAGNRSLWLDPLIAGTVVPESTAMASVAFSAVSPSLPQSLGTLRQVDVTASSMPADGRAIAWAYQGSTVPFFVEEAPATGISIRAEASCAGSMNCPTAGKSLVRLQGGIEAFVGDGSKNGGSATAVVFIRAGVLYSIEGPTSTFRPDLALSIANYIVTSTPS